MTSATTLTAHNLTRLLRTTAPHAAVEGIGLDQIDGVRFDSDGSHLHTIATDRYTVAVARARLQAAGEPSEPFARTVHGHSLPTLRAWADAHRGEAVLTLTAEADHLVLTGPRGTLRIPAGSEEFFDWRKLVHTTLADRPADGPCTRWTSRLWERWQHAGHEITTWHAGDAKPLLVLGADFIGLQAPHRPAREQTRTTAEALDAWKASLGPDTGQRLDLATVVPDPSPREYPTATTVPQMSEELLRQTLNATLGLHGAPSSDPGAIAAYALSGVHAWSAYRLLKALLQADPDLATATVADLTDQLEDGAISEWAWEAATDAGHDPQQWITARAKDQAAKPTTAASP
ncbi:hypothetical protein [Streptomyces buecherae]|uniref:hypothetical protein n=1 Tax=Streptomyces buecherae TaxID=2763006 RepID=UPI00379056D8